MKISISGEQSTSGGGGTPSGQPVVHHGHPAEASAMLFQIFVLIARLYSHKKTSNDDLWVKEFDKFIPPFIDYAQSVTANRGEVETKKLLIKMFEESSRVFYTAVRSAHVDPRFSHLEKTDALESLLLNSKMRDDVVKYGERFIDHVVEGKDDNVKSIVRDLVAITTTHRQRQK